jgi:hypothetical protein
MISRKSARLLGETVEAEFAHTSSRPSRNTYGPRTTVSETTIYREALYDFLFDHNYPAWLLNMVKGLRKERNSIKQWIMQLHTGETQVYATPEWSWEKRRQLGQQYLEELGQDLLGRLIGEQVFELSKIRAERINVLIASLELDGYSYVGGKLLRPESDVLDVEEERGLLHNLYASLGLENSETAFHHLTLSEEHYVAQKWDDSISNSRKFFECTLAEVASTFSRRVNHSDLSDRTLSRPFEVRAYLEEAGLLEAKEKDALAKVYGLLSETGGHPYMAQSDQARLLRHLGLTLSQFVLLRLQGKLQSAENGNADG